MNNQTTDTDDEFSLIDILSIVLRYRKLIIIGTVICTILAVVHSYLLPERSDKPKMLYTVIYSAQFAQLPHTVQTQLESYGPENITIAKLVQGKTMQRSFIASEYRKHPLFHENVENMDELAYSSYIANTIIGGQKCNVTFKGRMVTMTLETEDVSSADSLAKSVITDLNTYIENTLGPGINQAAVAAQRIIEAASTEGTISVKDAVSYSQQLQTIEDAKEFQNLKGRFLIQSDPPFITAESQSGGRLTKVIITAFASFFLFVFVAFLLNALKKIKNDTETVKKLSDAWNAGK